MTYSTLLSNTTLSAFQAFSFNFNIIIIITYLCVGFIHRIYSFLITIIFLASSRSSFLHNHQ